MPVLATITAITTAINLLLPIAESLGLFGDGVDDTELLNQCNKLNRDFIPGAFYSIYPFMPIPAFFWKRRTYTESFIKELSKGNINQCDMHVYHLIKISIADPEPAILEYGEQVKTRLLDPSLIKWHDTAEEPRPTPKILRKIIKMQNERIPKIWQMQDYIFRVTLLLGQVPQFETVKKLTSAEYLTALRYWNRKAKKPNAKSQAEFVTIFSNGYKAQLRKYTVGQALVNGQSLEEIEGVTRRRYNQLYDQYKNTIKEGKSKGEISPIGLLAIGAIALRFFIGV